MVLGKLGRFIGIFLLFVLCSLLIFCFVSSAETSILVQSSADEVDANDNFSIDVLCSPDGSDQIKAFEMKLDFDHTKLELLSFEYGDFFDGFLTFDGNVTNDNQQGLLYDIYSLIMGQGMVTNQGVLFTANFKVFDCSGDTTVEIFDVGLTNETSYLSITTMNATISINSDNQAPFSPSLSGPSSIQSEQSTSFSMVSSDPNDDSVRYHIDWGDGDDLWTSYADSQVSVSQSHAWDEPGSYVVSVYASDECGALSDTSQKSITVLAPETNSPPEKPNVPSGDASVDEDVSSLYSAVVSDPDGDDVQFRFGWGDSTGGWSSYVSSGSEVSASHSWSSAGSYAVRVQLRDEQGLVSEWSNHLEVTVEASDDDSFSVPNSNPMVPFFPSVENESDNGSSPLVSTFSGFMNVSLGELYNYSVVAVDDDGHEVQIFVEWGDGSNTSWSEFVGSNESVVFSHSWGSVGVFELRVIVRDELGLFSEWTESVEVVVGEDDSSEVVVEPVLLSSECVSCSSDVLVEGNFSVFELSSEVFEQVNGSIVSAVWDFGDGYNSTGLDALHSYNESGEYVVVLRITDEQGVVYEASRTVVVDEATAAISKQGDEDGFSFAGFFAVIVVALVIVVFVVFERRGVFVWNNPLHQQTKKAFFVSKDSENLSSEIDQFLEQWQNQDEHVRDSIPIEIVDERDNILQKNSLGRYESISSQIDEILRRLR